MYMKKSVLCLAVALCCHLSLLAQSEKMTNQSILDMIEMGFSDEVILTKIQTSEIDFDTSIEALKSLKAKGVSDSIIMAIMNGNKKQADANEEIAANKTGIYIYQDGEYTKILPTVFSGTKTNTLGSAFSYGIASAKIKSVMNNAHSTNIVNTSTPEFWFYFAVKDNDSFTMGASNWWFGSATSPNEFALAKLNVKKNKRELVTGKVNVYSGSSIGVDDKNAIPFSIEIINDYTFKVVPKEPLAAGEYCFFYQGTIPQGGFTNQSVFDFSVQPTE